MCYIPNLRRNFASSRSFRLSGDCSFSWSLSLRRAGKSECTRDERAVEEIGIQLSSPTTHSLFILSIVNFLPFSCGSGVVNSTLLALSSVAHWRVRVCARTLTHMRAFMNLRVYIQAHAYMYPCTMYGAHAHVHPRTSTKRMFADKKQ